MLIPRWALEKLVAVYDARASELKQSVDQNINALLASKEVSHQAVVTAKEQQIARLEKEVELLREQVLHERTRAEAAVDRLLARDANVAALAVAAPQEARETTKDKRFEALEKIFASVNGVGEDTDPPAADDMVEIAGQRISA